MKRTIKILSLVMALVLSAALMSAMPSMAATQVANGDFSEDLRFWDGTEDGKASIVEENGNKYMSMSLAAVSNISCYLVEVEAGKSYAWTFDIRSTLDIRVRAQFFDEDGVSTGYAQELTDQYYVTGGSEWTEAAAVVTANEGDAYMKIIFNNFKAGREGEVFIDNVSVHMLEVKNGELLTGGSLEVDTLPKNIKAAGASVISGAEAHGGTGKALKLENAAGETKTASAYCYAAKGQNIDAAVYMKLDVLDEADTSGVKLEVYSDGTKAAASRIGATSLFKATGEGWRKMMIPVSNLSNAARLEIRVTFTGAGTVLLDDFSAMGTDDLIRNGDLEGLTADYTPAGWTCSAAFTKNTDTATAYTAVENGNTYAGFKTTANLTMSSTVPLTAGVRYKLTFNYRNNVTDYGTIFHVLSLTPSQIWLPETDAKGAGAWGTQTIYFTAPETKAYNAVFGRRVDSTVSQFDNISLCVADDSDTLLIYEKDGAPAEKLEAGKTYTVRYTGFGTDYENAENNRKVQFAVAKYTKSGNAKMLETLHMETKSAEKIAAEGNKVVKSDVVGEVPLVIEYDFTVDEAGCSYKAFAWDAKDMLSSLTAAAALE